MNDNTTSAGNIEIRIPLSINLWFQIERCKDNLTFDNEDASTIDLDNPNHKFILKKNKDVEKDLVFQDQEFTKIIDQIFNESIQ